MRGDFVDLNLSKTSYCAAVQCPKMVWLRNRKPEVFPEGGVDESVLETGREVGEFAKKLFDDVRTVSFDFKLKMIEETTALIHEGCEYIAEASFLYDGLFASVDILHNLKNGEVEIYEVKSSTSIKDIYLDDVSFQRYILKKLGYKVKRVCIVYINNAYVRVGDIDIDELFVVEDVTEEAEAREGIVAENVLRFSEILNSETEPEIEIGEQCFAPYKCDCFKYCTRNLPSPNVFDVAGARTSTKFKCLRNGIVSFGDILRENALSKSQMKQVEHEVNELSDYIEEDAILEFMKTLSYPLYFLDFESYQPAIPAYQNSKPFEQIVFQYSLHYIEEEGGDLKHTEFLAYPGEDPRRALAEKLCEDIPLDVCTTAYNMAFEKTRIKSLAALYPDLAEHLMNIHDNIKDLMVPFQKKQYYKRAMQGSYSIKYVLPALFPNEPSLDYHNLEGVHNGVEASATFKKMATMNEEELENFRVHLLNYCGLDTFAMVKVWEKLNEAIGVSVRSYENK